ncbi:hypothetical protein DSO57_1003943 [Entomophthora muscae]|uniref:Uncharacterized protein n=2 Tax=Entomophthora muscae TaxID=34485 RepID=A0ACC2RZM6_9FUNG|nr:hypothetical protein DSO57_1003943 [Entomophthora muscae]
MREVMNLLAFAYGLVTAEYDYVVVGSGPGGGTLATELAMKGHKTLLIEAGPDYFKANQSTPAFQAKASEDPFISFDFNVKRHNNVNHFYPRAGALGGCSVHNAMISVYPNSRDFNLMNTITGDAKWSEINMRNYFKRLENNQYLVIKQNPSHGFKGWLKTSYVSLLAQLKLDVSLINYGLAVIGKFGYDINGKDGHKLNTDMEAKVFIPQAVDKTSFTRSNFPNYIQEVAQHYPLTIWTDTFVTRVLFNANIAVGVEYKKGRYLYKASPISSDANRNQATKGTVLAKKEVIISCGTFNTPQLLMLSGVGDRKHLSKFNISVVAHVPGVGRNMMDRYEVPISFKYSNKFKILKNCKFTPTNDDPCYREYIEKGTGPYTSNGILSGQLKKSTPNRGEPDLFLLHSLSNFHGYFRGYSNNIAQNTDSTSTVILKAHTNNTNGRVKLLSADPFSPPDINFHSFSDGDSDLQILVEAVKAERASLRKILVSHTEVYPGSNIQTDEQIRQYVKDIAWGHHACCTAKMGAANDPNAVVDAKFRVRGTKNLRVVDMSIFPKIPGYFPTVYIHMMAMKAAEDILI